MLDFQLSNLQAKHLTKGVHFCVFYGIMDIVRHRVGGGEMYNLALTLVARFAHDLAELQ